MFVNMGLSSCCLIAGFLDGVLILFLLVFVHVGMASYCLILGVCYGGL